MVVLVEKLVRCAVSFDQAYAGGNSSTWQDIEMYSGVLTRESSLMLSRRECEFATVCLSVNETFYLALGKVNLHNFCFEYISSMVKSAGHLQGQSALEKEWIITFTVDSAEELAIDMYVIAYGRGRLTERRPRVNHTALVVCKCPRREWNKLVGWATIS